MSVHPWHDVPLSADVADWFPAYIEIPKGSNIKYELDKRTGLLIVDRTLYSTVYYPANYGFVPRTWCDDGDPLDVLVLGDEPVVPQCLMRARAIGVMRMRDDKGQDDKIIAVHVDDAEYSHYRDVSELPPPPHEAAAAILSRLQDSGREESDGRSAARGEGCDSDSEAGDRGLYGESGEADRGAFDWDLRGCNSFRVDGFGRYSVPG